MPDADLLRQDAALLFEAVREAGALAMTLFRQQVRNWNKTDGSPVSEADLKVDALLARRLRSDRAAYGWLSEESKDATNTKCSKLWIVDPIDGTRSFINGTNEWCVAAALIDHGRPVAAAIYRPVCEEFYCATAGGGAMLNGNRLVMKDGATLEGAAVIGNVKSLERLAGSGIIAVARSAVPLQLRLAYVAGGQYDATISIGSKHDWDLAAGDLLVHEAGGIAGTPTGAAFRYNGAIPSQPGMIAAGVKRHEALINALRIS